MNFTTKFSLSVLFAAILLCAACGPTYVVQPNGQQVAVQQYDPGYNPDQFLYDTMLTAAILNGQRGYYGAGHVFYPYISVGGVDGYYDSGHHFHTSVTNKTVVINNYQHGREEFTKTHPLNAKPNYTGNSNQQSQQPAQKPNYTSTQNGGQGTIGRGAPTQQQAPQAQQKPNYTSQQNGGQGTIGRGAPQQQQQAPAVQSKPNYGGCKCRMRITVMVITRTPVWVWIRTARSFIVSRLVALVRATAASAKQHMVTRPR